jgi:beta-galactosidase
MDGGSQRERLDGGWKYLKGDYPGAEHLHFDDSPWKAVTLPHDWAIEGPFAKHHHMHGGFLPKGIGWYRRRLNLSGVVPGSVVYLEFEGVFRNWSLFVNGELAGTHPWGYTGHVFDITRFVQFGRDNVIAVKVDNPRPGDDPSYTGPRNEANEGWWYEGMGMYRPVWLIVKGPLHIPPWGTYLTTPEVSEAGATVRVQTTVRNVARAQQRCAVRTMLLDANGRPVATDLTDGADTTRLQDLRIASPRLWSLDTPHLYTARTEVMLHGECVDSSDTSFGIRWFEFTPDRGFFLNGKHMQLRGANIHHDFGGLGVALPDRAHWKNVEMLKEMGCNIIRSSHNDGAPALMDACDRLGMLVWAETRYLREPHQAAPPLRDLIRRNRNHPSVICWGLANTAGGKDDAQTNYLKALNEAAHVEDPSRPTAVALEHNADHNANGFAFVTDIVGYNGGGMKKDDPDHAQFPARKMLISEFSSGRCARGIYETEQLGPAEETRMGDGRIVKRQGCRYSCYDACRQHEEEWAHIAERPWLAGGIIWSGFEYWGETWGWPVVTSQFGVTDIARFPKDPYYFYLQEWTDKPMVRLMPHWTWPGRESREIAVWCYSNCDEVELLLNGRSLGVKPRVAHGHMEWKVPYAPGKLEARAMTKGEVVATHGVRTAGAPVALRLESDRPTTVADGRDLAFLTASVVDADGVVVPTANPSIAVTVSGAGRLLGLCNGDPACHELPKSREMHAFNGLLRVVVQSVGLGGTIAVKAASSDIVEARTVLEATQLHRPTMRQRFGSDGRQPIASGRDCARLRMEVRGNEVQAIGIGGGAGHVDQMPALSHSRADYRFKLLLRGRQTCRKPGTRMEGRSGFLGPC